MCTRLISKYIHVYTSSFHVQGKGCMFAFTSKDRRFSFAHFSISFAHLDCLHLHTGTITCIVVSKIDTNTGEFILILGVQVLSIYSYIEPTTAYCICA